MSLKEIVNGLLEDLEEGIKEVKNSEEFKQMLDFYSKFHQYSSRNQMLIWNQTNGQATRVAGYKQWKEKFNRQVQKGADSIKILVPQTSYKMQKTLDKNEDQEAIKEYKEKSNYKVEDHYKFDYKAVIKKKVTYFKYANVYDISDTKPIDETGEVPTIDISLKNQFSEILKLLIDFAESKNIELEFKSSDEDLKLDSKTHGYSKKGRVVINTQFNQTEQAATLIHELGHELLHGSKERVELSKEIKEMEAEAVAYIVMNYYDFEIESDKYLALYKKDYDLVKSLEKINAAATEIITFTKDRLNKKEQKAS